MVLEGGLCGIVDCLDMCSSFFCVPINPTSLSRFLSQRQQRRHRQIDVLSCWDQFEAGATALLCKNKRQYLIYCEVSRYCLLLSTAAPMIYRIAWLIKTAKTNISPLGVTVLKANKFQFDAGREGNFVNLFSKCHFALTS